MPRTGYPHISSHLTLSITYRVGPINNYPIIQRRPVRLKELNGLAQSHWAGKRGSETWGQAYLILTPSPFQGRSQTLSPPLKSLRMASAASSPMHEVGNYCTHSSGLSSWGQETTGEGIFWLSINQFPFLPAGQETNPETMCRKGGVVDPA